MKKAKKNALGRVFIHLIHDVWHMYKEHINILQGEILGE